MLGIAFIALLVFIILGVPVSFAIGLSGVLGLALGSDIPIFMAVQQMVRGMNSFPLMAAPFFILAGEIMGAAKLSDRIIDFSRSLVSWARGGLGFVCVVSNMIFAGISGSGAATMSAMGSLVVPSLKKEGYESSFVAALIAGSGALGPIIPPSVNMIIFGSLTGVSIGRMFIGGIIPGVLIGIGLMVMCYFYALKHNIDAPSEFKVALVVKNFKRSFFALVTPLIIIGGVVGGIYTATEAGIIACFYGCVCGFFIYRTLELKDMPRIFRRATESSAMLLMMMGIANIYSYMFARQNVGAVITEFLTNISANPTVIVALIIGLMLFLGCFMETVAVTIVVVPVVFPIVKALGFDQVAFGVLFTISAVIGSLTPPVGFYLFLGMKMTGTPFGPVAKQILPVVLIVLCVMIAILMFPSFFTYLPNLVF